MPTARKMIDHLTDWTRRAFPFLFTDTADIADDDEFIEALREHIAEHPEDAERLHREIVGWIGEIEAAPYPEIDRDRIDSIEWPGAGLPPTAGADGGWIVPWPRSRDPRPERTTDEPE